MSTLTRPRKIIVGLSDSVNSAAALRRACQEVNGYDAEICLVHVIAEDSSADQAAVAEREIAALVRQHATPGVRALARVQIERGEPGPILARMSADADLLIIGACTNSELRGIFSGAVVPFCLRSSSCPVRVCADHGQAHRATGDTSHARTLASG